MNPRAPGGAADADQPDSKARAIILRVLELEAKRSYDDRAVVGGLVAFLQRQDTHARDLGPLMPLLAQYSNLTPSERGQIVDQIRSVLSQGLGRPVSLPTVPESAGLNRTVPTAPAEPTAADGSVTALLDEAARAATSTAARPSGATPNLPESPRADQRTAAPRPSRPPAGVRLAHGSPITNLAGVGPTRAKRLANLGLNTAGDLLYHVPSRYVHYPPPVRAAELGFQHLASFEGVVSRVDVAPLAGRRLRITAILGDATGSVAAVWIRGGNVPSDVRQGLRLAISGQLTRIGRQITFENPEYEAANQPPLNTRRIVPVYPLTEGVSQSFMRGLVRLAMQSLPPPAEWLPAWIRIAEDLLPLDQALQQLHAPESADNLALARLRLAFDELLPMQFLALQRRQAVQIDSAIPVEAPWSLLAEFRRHLPFPLTGGQQRVLSTILEDMGKPRPMVRLLQGEVGSGKTVVAAMALLAAVAGGGQGVIMAPTEILAEQHLRTLQGLFNRAALASPDGLGHPLRLQLLTGALTRGERTAALAAIAAGEVDLVVGTHAVIQQDVEFPNLLLAVVDEQHRFGVNQRVAVRRKGANPHLLVMTATPIPRTLALTLFGDLDISTIDELPAGRVPIETVLLRPLARSRAYARIREAVAAGHQAFIICPLVEDSPVLETRAAVTEHARLQDGELAGLRLGLLHGRLRSADKDNVMRAFARGDYDVLVSTSVVEVGVDVPNATVMVIEGAERFGLAQLHQFRGRVGRGAGPGVCFLLAESESPDSLARLEAVERSTNGMELAEEDLRIRGPGEYFGLRQSGMPPLQIAQLSDIALIERVRRVAAQVLDRDPELESPEHAPLIEHLRRSQPASGEAN